MSCVLPCYLGNRKQPESRFVISRLLAILPTMNPMPHAPMQPKPGIYHGSIYACKKVERRDCEKKVGGVLSLANKVVQRSGGRWIGGRWRRSCSKRRPQSRASTCLSDVRLIDYGVMGDLDLHEMCHKSQSAVHNSVVIWSTADHRCRSHEGMSRVYISYQPGKARLIATSSIPVAKHLKSISMSHHTLSETSVRRWGVLRSSGLSQR